MPPPPIDTTCMLYVHFGHTNLEIGCYGPHSILRPCTDYIATTGVIYFILCQDCDHSYVVETDRTLKSRPSEHRRSCQNGESTIVQHTIEEDHRIDWEGSTVISGEKKRRVKEALLICRHTSLYIVHTHADSNLCTLCNAVA